MQLDPEVLSSFHLELLKIASEKDAGFGDAMKGLLLKDIGGPKGLLTPIGQATANVGKRVAKAAPTVTRRTAGGAYDVSRMAQQMGL